MPHRKNRSPGQRFRIEQYLDILKENNYKIIYSHIISEKDDKIFYSKGKYFLKSFIVIKSFFIRLIDFFRSLNSDIVFIYREAFMLGTVFFEKIFKLSGAKIIFDFDDAIWLNDISEGNENLKWLKNPSKISKIIKLSDMVFAGNNYLLNYAEKFNNNVKIIPTTIDINYHKKIIKKNKDNVICIGWTGTSTTLKHFESAIQFLKKIKSKYQEKVKFKIIVDFQYKVDELNLISTEWNISTEINDLSEIDIGIMPLPDDDWSKGKCGFKGLQYMALEIPTVMSPIGINTEIIEDGINGFLAKTDKEWFEKLSLLIESKELREKLGKNGRKTIIEKYSVNSQKEKYIDYFNELIIGSNN